MDPTRLFAYFRQRYEGRVEVDERGEFYSVQDPRGGYQDERLHLALSADGRHYTAVNQGRPVWDRWLRDPFLARAPDGVWHLVATTHGRRSILHASSIDLLHWNGDDVPVAEGLVSEDGRTLNNAWAPEWVWDGEQFFVFWSSSFERDGWHRSRLYSCRTRDWRTFTAPQLLFAPPYSVIDGSLLHSGGRWWLFHKEEEFGRSTGERRAIRLAVADALDGPYDLVGDPIAPTITEGPAVTADPLGSGWLLSYDFCMADGYGLAHSEDLRAWAPLEGDFPDGARHGSVSVLTPDDAPLIAALSRLSIDLPDRSEHVDGGRPPA
ncbi:MAG: glycoside hydrolase family 43 [Naasia sp.]|uniref:glycoside hydrolase family 43 protein n=1 Tax=Naasia sp. TaxID=2546198 RepID=UPI002628D46F|nr:glycoside hydrolase family 43 protein [Naasia sp.]MCU1570398.1 glycoside hydrolase family 43 [Naasia sp.]